MESDSEPIKDVKSSARRVIEFLSDAEHLLNSRRSHKDMSTLIRLASMEFIWLAREATLSENIERSTLESIIISWGNFTRISELLRDDEWAIFLTSKAWPELYDYVIRNVDVVKNDKRKVEILNLIKNAQWWLTSGSKKEQYISQYLRSQKEGKHDRLERQGIAEILRLIHETKEKIDFLSSEVTGEPPSLQVTTISKELPSLKEHKSEYALEGYKVFFSHELARQYEPVVYSGECMSGNPEALYYRILQNEDKNKFCIQYFYYWRYQHCMMSSHTYDYEPIFIYLELDDPNPYLVVNSGLGPPDCNYHKNEVRPNTGRRDDDVRHVTTKLSPNPFYPFGQSGNVKSHICLKTYPLFTAGDLQFEKRYHPVLGVRACSNVFSGYERDLYGHRFDPPLKKLTDEVLSKWYFHHYKNTDDFPFGHDIADPFTSPYIKFHKPSREEVDRLRKQRR